MRAVSGLKQKMDEDARRVGVLIACDPDHVKYPKLRRIVKAFQGSEAEMATFVEALTQESL